MSASTSRPLWIGCHTLVFLGWAGGLVGLMGNSLPLVAAASGLAVVGSLALLSTGALRYYPRKRAASIVMIVAGGLLFSILVGLRLYAGPTAWSG